MAPSLSRFSQLALDEVLACPRCRGRLTADANGVACNSCKGTYGIHDEILHLFVTEDDEVQNEERALRDVVMGRQKRYDRRTILQDVARHHCLPVMAERARNFRSKFWNDAWILDVGTGSGWYWADTKGARIIALDFSLESLNVARNLLSAEPDIVFIWADARRLPIRNSALSGIWSVQVLQHLPQSIFCDLMAEFDRVLGNTWFLELYNLNPAPLHKAIYRLFGRKQPHRGRVGPMEINLFSASELLKIWNTFRAGYGNAECGYSELFFHPDLRFKPPIYPTFIERQIAARLPTLASLFARQIHVQLAGSRSNDHS